jgi:hypothetical protein
VANNLPDLWNTCYEGEHRSKKSPEAFKKQFCDVCMNSGCRNSKGSTMSWSERMRTQAELLLHNPRFSDPNDPNFAAIRGMNFEDKLREALAIEVSIQKGDWSIPTEAEIGRAAAEMVGILPPSGFKDQTKLVDEVRTTGLDGQLNAPQVPTPMGGEPDEDEWDDVGPPPVDENGRRYLSETWTAELEPDEAVYAAVDAPEPESWRIRGDSGTIYEVSLTPAGEWGCTCPSRENPCKHARYVAGRLKRSPEPSTVPPTTSAPKEEPPVPPRPPPLPKGMSEGAPPPAYRPKDGQVNTRMPSEGVMVGGGSPTPPAPLQEADPWAPPPAKPKERIIPVGGRVILGGGNKKD